LTLFSLLGCYLSADGVSPGEKTGEVPQEETAAGQTDDVQVAEAPDQKEGQPSKARQALFPKKTAEQRAADELQAQDLASPKKLKPQYAGARRSIAPEVPEKKKSRKAKNEWFSSKTQPKAAKKEVAEKLPESSKDRPWYKKAGHEVASLEDVPTDPSGGPASQPQNNAGEDLYPRTGFQAPKGQVILTGEWLYWRTRQEGMEFATSKQIEFEFQSGYRVGLGVHLPSFDGWCIYANYTNFNPEHSHSAHGSFYPLFLFQGSNPSHARGPAVAKAEGHWRIEFQTLDVDFGRPYYLSKTLVFSPFFGLKGVWIEQHAHFHYEGGFIPARKTFRTQFKNDFKGAGPLVGTGMNWQLGAGFSLFGDIAAALLVGQFDMEQRQHQHEGREVVHLDSDFNLISPTLQMVAGIAWDRTFSKERRHLGLSAGFETQYWWSQNQTEQFTDAAFPSYVRQRGDLAFYGLTLRARVDF
jgi:hypothetical protein